MAPSPFLSAGLKTAAYFERTLRWVRATRAEVTLALTVLGYRIQNTRTRARSFNVLENLNAG